MDSNRSSVSSIYLTGTFTYLKDQKGKNIEYSEMYSKTVGTSKEKVKYSTRKHQRNVLFLRGDSGQHYVIFSGMASRSGILDLLKLYTVLFVDELLGKKAYFTLTTERICLSDKKYYPRVRLKHRKIKAMLSSMPLTSDQGVIEDNDGSKPVAASSVSVADREEATSSLSMESAPRKPSPAKTLKEAVQALVDSLDN